MLNDRNLWFYSDTLGTRNYKFLTIFKGLFSICKNPKHTFGKYFMPLGKFSFL